MAATGPDLIVNSVVANWTYPNTGNNQGSSTLTKNGTGWMLLNGSDIYTGGTVINGGNLPDGEHCGIRVPASLTASGLLDLNGFSLSVGAFSGSGTIDNVTAGGGVTLTVGSGGGSGVFSGTLQNTTGTIALVKAGNGTQTLSGANTYLGTTTVNGGTLLAANTAALPSWQNAGTITVSGAGSTLALQGGTAAGISAGEYQHGFEQRDLPGGHEPRHPGR